VYWEFGGLAAFGCGFEQSVHQLSMEVMISAERWADVQRRVGTACRFAGLTGLVGGIAFGLVASIALVRGTATSAISVAVYSLLLAASFAVASRAVARRWSLTGATSDLVSEVAKLEADRPSAIQLAKLATNESVLVGETFIRASRRDDLVELTTHSVHDVPDEFKGGRDLWFSGWFGGEVQ
jgi:hypothetical protein